MAIKYHFDGDVLYKGFQLDLDLPESISIEKDDAGNLMFENGNALADHTISTRTLSSGKERFMVVSMNNTVLSGTEGTLFSIYLLDDGSHETGSVFTVDVNGILFTNAEGKSVPFDDTSFTITVGDKERTILDELDSVIPATEDGVDVLVKRTIKGGEWSTICLPFAMTGEQAMEAFGDDVQLADFKGYEAFENEDGDITTIKVKFNTLSAEDGMEANHPYLIKVSNDIMEFVADGVNVEPDEEPVVAAVKRTRRAWSEMIGTYVANTVVPEQTLFLNGNKFWYSTGKTKMKGFRAYFDFYDILTEIEAAAAQVSFAVDEETLTGIDSDIFASEKLDAIYDLQGRKLPVGARLNKGIYIMNGKKQVIK